ncbi:MAG: hypothetical protein QOJ13_1866 [Gaiellales bacterium]|jgi:hypothetical protein|nr:hypothetical protein [Gaiellales bacterium]MDX6592670.1 hypothetical protein [Gaiellales bacterium]
MNGWGGSGNGVSEPEEPVDRAGAVRVATEWLTALNSFDDETAVRLSEFTVAQLGLVRRSLAGADAWNATSYRQEYAPGIEQLMFIDEVTGRSGKLLVQKSDDGWKVLALLEADGSAYPRAPARVQNKAMRGKRAPKTAS